MNPKFSTDVDPTAREPVRSDQTQWLLFGAHARHQRCNTMLCPLSDLLQHDAQVSNKRSKRRRWGTCKVPHRQQSHQSTAPTSPNRNPIG